LMRSETGGKKRRGKWGTTYRKSKINFRLWELWCPNLKEGPTDPSSLQGKNRLEDCTGGFGGASYGTGFKNQPRKKNPTSSQLIGTRKRNIGEIYDWGKLRSVRKCRYPKDPECLVVVTRKPG